MNLNTSNCNLCIVRHIKVSTILWLAYWCRHMTTIVTRSCNIFVKFLLAATSMWNLKTWRLSEGWCFNLKLLKCHRHQRLFWTCMKLGLRNTVSTSWLSVHTDRTLFNLKLLPMRLSSIWLYNTTRYQEYIQFNFWHVDLQVSWPFSMSQITCGFYSYEASRQPKIWTWTTTFKLMARRDYLY